MRRFKSPGAVCTVKGQAHVRTGNRRHDPREKWGNGQVVISERGKTGSWIMFDPEEDEVNLENWR